MIFGPLASLSFGSLISFYSRRRVEHGLRLREEERLGESNRRRSVGWSVVCSKEGLEIAFRDRHHSPFAERKRSHKPYLHHAAIHFERDQGPGATVCPVDRVSVQKISKIPHLLYIWLYFCLERLLR